MDHTTIPSMVDEHWVLLEIVSLKSKEKMMFYSTKICFTFNKTSSLFIYATIFF